MELNQTTLRSILAAITSVNNKNIVPKQGNWWNPQENPGNVNNWCAYQIRSNSPRTAPFYTEEKENGVTINSCAVQKIATIDLQFVGPDSEDIAQSVAMWPMRSDVKQAFASVQGAIMYDDMTAVSSTFYQDGNNTVIAWNVTIRVLWTSIMETSQQRITTIETGGRINV